MDYNDWSLHELPPNGQGIAALMALGILKHTQIENFEVDSVESIHLQIEAIKLAYADLQRYVASGASMEVSSEALLNESYLSRRALTIDTKKASVATAGAPSGGGTVYIATADASGMMVSLIQSNWMGFGSGVVVPGTGISLHNRGTAFSLDPSHPNVVAPRKRPSHTIIPGFLSYGGNPIGPLGVMGGSFQAQGHLQITIRLSIGGQNPQAASDAPRWRFVKGLEIKLEHGFQVSVARGLARLGHEITFDDSAAFGGAQIILKHEGVFMGASDHRKDGLASGY